MRSKTLFPPAGVMVALSLLASVSAAAGTATAEADALLARHRAATGGEAAWAKIVTRQASGSLERNGSRIRFVQSQQAPNRLRTATFFPRPGTLTQGYDGTTGWVLHPTQGGRKLAGRELAGLAAGAWLRPAEHLAEQFSVRRLGEPCTVDGRALLVLHLGGPEGTPAETWLFDADTALLAQVNKTLDAGSQGLVPITLLFEDYRAVDGVTVAFRVRTRLPTMETILQFEKVEHNVAFPDGFFSASF